MPDGSTVSKLVSPETLARMVYEAPMGVVATDAALSVVGWNRWMENATGLRAEEVIGKRLPALYAELEDEPKRRFYELALSGQEVVLAQRFHGNLLTIEHGGRAMQQSARISPMIDRDRVVGTLTYIEDVSERVDREAQLRSKIDALEEAQVRLKEQEEEIRRALDYERTLLQTLAESFNGKAPTIGGLDLACRYHAAYRNERFGGDYIDFIPLANDCLGMAIADVCGKGLRAGVYTAMAKYTLRAFSYPEQPPRELLSRVNEQMHRQICEDGLFVTMAYVALDLPHRKLTCVNAGHVSPLIYRSATDECQLLSPTGPPLAVFANPQYREHDVALEKGDILVLVTDGIVDVARDDNEGMLGDLIRSVGPLTDVETLADAIVADALTRVHGNHLDDMALIVLRIP